MAILDQLRASLSTLDLLPQDKAAVALAERYAAALDVSAADPAKLGPPLLAVLSALGMTPAGRAAVLGKGVTSGDSSGRSRADELRERRAARIHAATAVDPTAG